jgi:hypothetical protein
VTVSELIRGVCIALGIRPVATCQALDTAGDGRVTVDETIMAVKHAMNGCAG